MDVSRARYLAARTQTDHMSALHRLRAIERKNPAPRAHIGDVARARAAVASPAEPIIAMQSAPTVVKRARFDGNETRHATATAALTPAQQQQLQLLKQQEARARGAYGVHATTFSPAPAPAPAATHATPVPSRAFTSASAALSAPAASPQPPYGPSRAVARLPPRADSAPAATRATEEERQRARWTPPQTDADSCFFYALVVALFTSFSVDDLQRAATRETEPHQLDTREPALLVALYSVREIAGSDLADVLLESLRNLGLAPINDLATEVHECAAIRMHAERGIEDVSLRSAEVIARLMTQYNRQMVALQRGLLRYAPRRDTPRTEDEVARTERAWRALRRVADAARKGGALEEVDLAVDVRTHAPLSFATTDERQLRTLAAIIDVLSDAMRAGSTNTLATDATDDASTAALQDIAAVMQASKHDFATPSHPAARECAVWRRMLFERNYPQLLRHQQSADDTLRALLAMLDVHGLLRRATYSIALPAEFPYDAARQAGSLRSIALANAQLRLPALPYTHAEEHVAVLDNVDADVRDLRAVYPQVARVDLERRTILNIAQLADAPAILILSRQREGAVRAINYGTYEPKTARCTLEIDLEAAARAINDVGALLPESFSARRDRAVATYELRAVVCWHGAADGSSGHYTAWTYEDQAWFFYNSGPARHALPGGTAPENVKGSSLDPRVAAWAPSIAGSVFFYARIA